MAVFPDPCTLLPRAASSGRVASRWAAKTALFDTRLRVLNVRPLVRYRQRGNPIEADRCGEVDGQQVCGDDFEFYEALVASIRRNGVREPVTFAAWGGRPHLVDGHHRLNAAWEAEAKTIPAQVDKALTDEWLVAKGLLDRLPRTADSRQAARPIPLPEMELRDLANHLTKAVRRSRPRPGKTITAVAVTVPHVKGRDVTVHVALVGSLQDVFSPNNNIVQGGYLNPRKDPPLIVIYINSTSSLAKVPDRIVEDEIYRILMHELTHAADVWSGKGSVGDLSKSKDELKQHHHNHPAEVKALMRDVVTQVEPTVQDYLEVGMSFNDAVRFALLDSKWPDIEPHLTSKNRKTILKGVYTHLQDRQS